MANNMCSQDLKAFKDAQKLYKQVAINMCQILSLWPPLRELYGVLPRIARAAAYPPPLMPHSPTWDRLGECRRCVQCHRRGAKLLANSRCVSFSPSLSGLVQRASEATYQHTLWVSMNEDTQLPLLFCMRCGYMAGGRANRLLGPCLPCTSSLKDLSKIRRGILPGGSGHKLSPPWPVKYDPTAVHSLTPTPSRLFLSLKDARRP